MNLYRDYHTYLRELFGERVQKITLDAGLTCPNRDGTICRGGCIYCDSRGSGTGAMIHRGLSIAEQMRRGSEFAGKRYGAKKFIAYFQSFSNTYAPLRTLKNLYDQALIHPGVVGLSVGTRPDCITSEILDLLSSYRDRFLVWLELGLQSAHDATLLRINRGHSVACFDRAAAMADACGLNVCAHVILGLPGETRTMMVETACHLASLPVKGLKIHALYIVKGVALATMHEKGLYQCLTREEYVESVVDFLERIPPDVIIQRLTGDPNPLELQSPDWVKDKWTNLRLIRKRLEERDAWQGKKYRPQSFTAAHGESEV
ncbi:MAG: TIGR01212 family radical SAM protein [Deltaproteobacteria bacterium]|nr:TIGR01212 family radical SAM protein [Deltaproteobacteria bacterium]